MERSVCWTVKGSRQRREMLRTSQAMLTYPIQKNLESWKFILKAHHLMLHVSDSYRVLSHNQVIKCTSVLQFGEIGSIDHFYVTNESISSRFPPVLSCAEVLHGAFVLDIRWVTWVHAQKTRNALRLHLLTQRILPAPKTTLILCGGESFSPTRGVGTRDELKESLRRRLDQVSWMAVFWIKVCDLHQEIEFF